MDQRNALYHYLVDKKGIKPREIIELLNEKGIKVGRHVLNEGSAKYRNRVPLETINQ